MVDAPSVGPVLPDRLGGSSTAPKGVESCRDVAARKALARGR
jgi:hypothetical protein